MEPTMPIAAMYSAAMLCLTLLGLCLLLLWDKARRRKHQAESAERLLQQAPAFADMCMRLFREMDKPEQSPGGFPGVARNKPQARGGPVPERYLYRRAGGSGFECWEKTPGEIADMHNTRRIATLDNEERARAWARGEYEIPEYQRS